MAQLSILSKRFNRNSVAFFGLTFIALGAGLPNVAQAEGLTFVTSRSALGGNDSVDLGVVGIPGVPFISVPNPFSVTSSGGLDLTISKTFGPFQTAQQSSAADGPFSANFGPRDALISTTRQTTGPVTITFSSLVSGAGTQVESFQNGAFNATIEALDSQGNSLGSFSVPGIARYGGSGDNTAPFVGVLSSSANIASLRINGEREPGTGFAFNRLDIVSQPDSTSVPEPDFSVFSATAFVGLLAAKRVFLKKKSS